jgi:hypothetical protein
MSFMRPKIPAAPPPANAAVSPIQASAGLENQEPMRGPSSFITTSGQGLKRKPETQRTSLIGG